MGYAFLVGNGNVAWSSKKQTTIALSTMEAEYMAFSYATRHTIWLRALLAELTFMQKGPTSINAVWAGPTGCGRREGYLTKARATRNKRPKGR